jgi:hypothetical protein
MHARGNRIGGYGSKFRLQLEPLESRRMLSAVTARQLFYNQSKFDLNDPAVTTDDDAAIATDKIAYRPGLVATIRQLTNNNVIDQNAQVSGSNIVWQGQGGTDGGTDYEIFRNDGTTTTQLTTNANTVADTIPQVSTGGVAWQRGSSTTAEIVFNDFTSETVLTSNSTQDANPIIAGGRVNWQGGGTGNAIEVMNWEAGTTSNYSQDAVIDAGLSSDGPWTVWVKGSTPSQEVRVAQDGTGSSTLIATDTRTMANPDVAAQPPGGPALPKVVWEGFAGGTTNDREIYYFDGVTTTRLTNNSFPDFNPRISGNKIVWWGGTFNNFHIYEFDGTSVKQISTGLRNQFPQIDGDNVVWYGQVGSLNQIFYYNGTDVLQVTNNDRDNTIPKISGNHIVWQGQLGPNGTALEIFDAVIGPGPSTFANVSSYSRGINGVMVDLTGAHGAISASDFIFKVGNNNSPGSWTTATGPTTISVRAGAGVNGADRIELVWNPNDIQKTWLEVVVKGNDTLGGSNTNTGLDHSDVFFFGNALGDSGAADAGAYSVNSADEISARSDPHSLGNPAPITNVNDFDRDGLVGSTDQIIARNNITNLGNQLKFLSLTAAGPFAPALAGSDASTQQSGDASTAVALALAATPSSNGVPGGRVDSRPPRPPAEKAVDACFERLASDAARPTPPHRARPAHVDEPGQEDESTELGGDCAGS